MTIESRSKEVLRSLVLLSDTARLARGRDGWAFRGYWQDPAVSGVGDDVIDYLFMSDQIRESSPFAFITESGRAVLATETRELVHFIREVLPTLPGIGSQYDKS
jgi:hypothetical protein